MGYKILLLAAGSTLALGACSTTSSVMDISGSAVTANINAQAIAPPPEQKANTNIPADETLRAAARKRYRDGEVYKPAAQTTN